MIARLKIMRYHALEDGSDIVDAYVIVPQYYVDYGISCL
jgi:hypothetical protein